MDHDDYDDAGVSVNFGVSRIMINILAFNHNNLFEFIIKNIQSGKLIVVVVVVFFL